jgi:bis(5'-nucleosidyl)-tetraphosphatase
MHSFKNRWFCDTVAVEGHKLQSGSGIVLNSKIFSAGVVVVRKEQGQFLYLLLRAYKHWDFPKGMVEENETAMEGARREVEEESTITQLDFHWGEQYIETGPYGRGKIARYYLAETQTRDIHLPVNPELGRPEHEEYRWVGYDEAKGMVSARVRSILEWANNIIKYNESPG